MYTAICVKNGKEKNQDMIEKDCVGCCGEMQRQCDEYNENNHKKYNEGKEE